MATSTQVIPTKLALRRMLKAQRQGRSDTERQEIGRAIAAVGLELPRIRHADCVTLYASLPDEPGTELLRDGLRELGVRVLLPVVGSDRDDRSLDWAQDVGRLNPAGPLGLPEPPGPRLGPDGIGQAQVLIVPALAVDTASTRLGRGGGYYDAALPRAHPQALILALIHDQELLDAESTPIPREPHDVAVHGVITPTRWLFFSPSPG